MRELDLEAPPKGDARYCVQNKEMLRDAKTSKQLLLDLQRFGLVHEACAEAHHETHVILIF